MLYFDIRDFTRVGRLQILVRVKNFAMSHLNGWSNSEKTAVLVAMISSCDGASLMNVGVIGKRRWYVVLHIPDYVIINSNNRFDRIIMALSNCVVIAVLKRDY